MTNETVDELVNLSRGWWSVRVWTHISAACLCLPMPAEAVAYFIGEHLFGWSTRLVESLIDWEHALYDILYVIAHKVVSTLCWSIGRCSSNVSYHVQYSAAREVASILKISQLIVA